MKWPKRRLELRDFGMALYLLSLVLPAVRQEDNNWLHGTLTQDTLPGWCAFIMGLLSIVYGYAAWLANPLFIAAYRTRSAKRSFVYAVLALLAGLSVQLQLVTWYDEDGRFTVTGYTYGYYAWLLSFTWLAGLAVVKARKETISEHDQRVKSACTLKGKELSE
ncbi:hypothetical protein [Pseudomonas lini]